MAALLNSSENFMGYGVGVIQAQGAFTSEIKTAVPRFTVQEVIDRQYPQSLDMMKRPGMYLKFLPSRYDEATGQLLTGGGFPLSDVLSPIKQHPGMNNTY
ncbi:hypothetical protein Ct61P_06343 [Colletotrichum tofieldiae]|nr:hypothetical protein Ct61P_06343 [Colletotrichum tofieldiae]